ncbi:MAG: N-acetyl-gamma-glutamyl-phosphate reductase [Syntrophales bacterium]|nr:N-acetyl-gamma-glutamyl-phosphate reductase [Syntrophales bacterium]
MPNIAIYGASGYTGQELLRILLRHPHGQVTAVTSRRYAGQSVADLYPAFTNMTDLHFEEASPESVARRCDVVFLALPHGVSMAVAGVFLDAGCKVIDLSADFRLRHREVYERWYTHHEAPQYLAEAVYGIPELYRDKIRRSRLVANPGCYPTSIILGLAPVLKAGLIDPATIIVDAKSGVSGAGREPVVSSLFCEVDEAFKAYKVAGHRHTPEIEQELGGLAGREVAISFTPHLLPLSRGILSTIYASLIRDVSLDDVLACYAATYRDEPFVRIYKKGTLPNVSAVRGANFCDIGAVVDGRTRRLIVVSVIDNLVKGASGQAVQDLNIMCGFAEDAGLRTMPLYP